jgi:hypothetical protein
MRLKSLEIKSERLSVVDCQGPVTSRGCIPTSVLQLPLHESLIAGPHTAQALLRDARALRPTLRSHFTVRAEPYVTMSMAGVTSSLDVQDRYAVVFEPWRCPIAVEVRSRKELHKRIPKYTTTGVGYLATYLVLGSRIMLTLAS